jgi:putative oxygen-independent coproporphyrinogen III oxidase
VNKGQSFLSLYLHIPFCHARCTYCAFNTYTNAESLIADYVAAMCGELEWLGRSTKLPVHTIYFGGGTPSVLLGQQATTILETCRRVFTVIPQAEVTLEANPGSARPDFLEQIRAAGVNRLSVGMQSARANELRMFARQHDVAAVANTIEAARRAGFDNVSLDLIFGAPNQTLDTWRESVEAALSLRPDHLSMYALILETGTALTRSIESGTLPVPDDDLAADMYELAHDLAEESGLMQYEICNWAKPGMECLHNLQYWRNEPYLGVGAGAHGYAAGIRYEVVRPIQRYIDLARSQDTALPFPITPSMEHNEPVDTSAAMAEHMMTGLRLTREGFKERFGHSIDKVFGEALAQLTGYGLLVSADDSIRLTNQARLLSNRVFLEFMQG